MTQTALSYRWSRSEFARAWEAGAFDHRVELIDGDVWPVVIGSWQGDTVGQLLAALPRSQVQVTTATLPTGRSLPDPDCWVRRAGATPVDRVGSRLDVWDASDVLLVVEVSDDTVLVDLNVKSALYGKAGYPVYWVVTRDAIYEHTGPTPQGYRTRTQYGPGVRRRRCDQSSRRRKVSTAPASPSAEVPEQWPGAVSCAGSVRRGRRPWPGSRRRSP